MKKIISFIVLFFVTLSLFSQVTISADQYRKLSSEDKEKFKQLNEVLKEKNSFEQTIETFEASAEKTSKYVEMGKGIGQAVNTTLIAVEDSALRISNTPLGKTAIAVVVWKLIGKDIIGILFAIVVFIFGMILTYKQYRRSIIYTKLISKKWINEGKGWEKQYVKINDGLSSGERNGRMLGAFASFAGTLGICALALFA